MQENTQMYYYINRAAIGGFNSGSYWSSTESSAKKSSEQPFGSPDTRKAMSKSTTYGVRPIRAF